MNHGNMDMASSTIASLVGTATQAASGATTTAASMDEMSMGGGCKISMLWNWNTIDSCFISSSWHVKTAGAFAGSCIGVLLLVVLLEALRRAGKEYDQFITWKHVQAHSAAAAASPIAAATTSSKQDSANESLDGAVCAPVPRFRPSFLQQAVRALLHTFQFAVAYFVMLLAMYYNGYIIICIFIGAYLGSFIFHWEYLTHEQGPTRAGNNPTVCCG